MMFRYRKMQFACMLSAFLMVTMFVVMQFVNTQSAHAATNQFKGVNWADPRDNYANDPVVPSGLHNGTAMPQPMRKPARSLVGLRRI